MAKALFSFYGYAKHTACIRLCQSWPTGSGQNWKLSECNNKCLLFILGWIKQTDSRRNWVIYPMNWVSRTRFNPATAINRLLTTDYVMPQLSFKKSDTLRAYQSMEGGQRVKGAFKFAACVCTTFSWAQAAAASQQRQMQALPVRTQSQAKPSRTEPYPLPVWISTCCQPHRERIKCKITINTAK